MHERSKLQEAEYFLQRMSSVASQPYAFQHELSAFMTASRSVLQYAHKETSKNPSAQSWYDGAVRVDPVLRYFKDKRDTSIHSEPVRPETQVSVKLSATLQPSSSLHLIKRDSSGRMVEERTVTSAALPAPQGPSQPHISYVHRFPDWTGPEDVLMLGERYLTSLKSFVDGGVAGGFIAG
jgi:hypothetical protein